jgi:hypothetical protein
MKITLSKYQIKTVVELIYKINDSVDVDDRELLMEELVSNAESLEKRIKNEEVAF